MAKKREQENEILKNEKILRENRKILASLFDHESVPLSILNNLGFEFRLHTSKATHNGNAVIFYHDMGITYLNNGHIKIISADEL